MANRTPPLLNDAERAQARQLIKAALQEDLSEAGDLTSNALIPLSELGSVNIVARQAGVLSGLPFVDIVFNLLGEGVTVVRHVQDGADLEPGMVVATLSGPVHTLLSGERTALNLLTLLSGNASLTAKFVDAVSGTRARILDTRKTLPGLRLLQKYAIRCGGGINHRIGLYDAVLIKDNHIGAWNKGGARSLKDILQQARAYASGCVTIEIEVDTLEQLRDALGGKPDIVLLDNMTLDMLREAVSIRNTQAPTVHLEASGGVNLETVRDIALTGVDRISIGALTHSAPALDLAFDWVVEQ
ncbi:MAG: carboxylating nicotinate-nucleotide diphosphorylase [Planctomycetaceae bacterium]